MYSYLSPPKTVMYHLVYFESGGSRIKRNFICRFFYWSNQAFQGSSRDRMLIPKPYFGTDNQGGHPPQGLSEARRVRKVFLNIVIDPPRGRPFGGGGVHPTGFREVFLFIKENSDRTYRCHSIKTEIPCCHVSRGSLLPVNRVAGQMVFLP